MTQQRHATRWMLGVALTLGLLAGVMAVPSSARADSGQFAATGSMSVPRSSHTQSTLQNGTVLVAGGEGGSCGFFCLAIWDSSELYDPAAGTFTAGGMMTTPRADHTATVLPDGRVLVTGGWVALLAPPTATAEIYDPATDQFSATGSMSTPRRNHTASLLPDGRVLITGGQDNTNQPLASAEVFDPASGTFTNTGTMSTPRYSQTATPLPGGMTLVAGGRSTTGALPTATAELYDPGSGTFAATGSMSTPRGLQTASVLQDGRVLVAGGDTTEFLPSPTATAELYDPATATFSPTGSMSAARSAQTATVLASGDVLIAGGQDAGANSLPTAENYSSETGAFSATGDMTAPRRDAAATALPDGKVLVTGGQVLTEPTATADLYDTPLPRVSLSSSSLDFGTQPVSGMTAGGRSAAAGAQTLTVRNTGTFPLRISSVTVTGADADSFSVSGDCAGTSVAAGSTCAASVTFDPTSSGSKSATLRLADNALDSPQTVALSGSGAPAPTPSPTPTPTPTPSPTVRTELQVAARPAAKRLTVGKRSRVVRSIDTNGTLKRLEVSCLLHGHKVTGKQRRSVCLTAKSKRRGVVEVAPLCSTRLRITVRIAAKAPGAEKATWQRSWRVEQRPRVVCSRNGKG